MIREIMMVVNITVILVKIIMDVIIIKEVHDDQNTGEHNGKYDGYSNTSI